MLHGTMFATMMVRMGDADGMVSGAAHTTADTIRPALQLLQTKDKTLVSSIFFMLLPDRVLVYGDCAVNVDPTAEHLADIARVSADTARAFGLEPRVAMLSYSTLGSGAGPQVEKVEKATQMLREQVPDLDVEGPIQYDAAVDPRVAESKVNVEANLLHSSRSLIHAGYLSPTQSVSLLYSSISVYFALIAATHRCVPLAGLSRSPFPPQVKKESKVAGRANVLVFPDLNTGNNTYKAVQQSTGGIAMGPVLQVGAACCTVMACRWHYGCLQFLGHHSRDQLPGPCSLLVRFRSPITFSP